MRCTICKSPLAKYVPNGRPPICPICSRAKQREKNHQWKENHPARTRELNRIASAKYKKYKPDRTRNNRGIDVLQPGCGTWDNYTKVAFYEWEKKHEFPVGTLYRIDGKEYEIYGKCRET